MFHVSISYAGYSFSRDSFFTDGYQILDAPVVIDKYSCSGNETTLADCEEYDYGSLDAKCGSHGGVRCEGNCDGHTCEHIKDPNTLITLCILFLKYDLDVNPTCHHAIFLSALSKY